MMKAGRYKLYMSTGLAILLIIQAIVFIAIRPNMTSGLWFLFSVIILLALMVVGITVVMAKKIEHRVNKLPSSYVSVYMDAQELIGLSSMNRTMKSETSAMILEIFEHAALENRLIEDVICNDLEEFMKEFITAAGGDPIPLYWFSYSSLLFIGYLLLMKVYKVVKIGNLSIEHFKTETLDVGIVLTYALIAYLFFPWLMIVMKKAAREQWLGIKRIYIMLPFIIPVGLMSLLIGVNTEPFRKFLDHPIIIFSSIYSFFIGILVFVGCIGLMKYSQKKQLK
jgi:DNA-binding ferritin-like protein (Dps family)